jgi:hypothetical protein
MNSSSPLTHAEKIICGFAIALGLYFVAAFVMQVWGNDWPGPLFDYWIDIPLIEKAYQHTLTFNDLASAHNNAHRILIPRLLFILDYRFFSGTNTLLVMVSVLCKIATLLLFCILLEGQARIARAVLGALACAAIFNAGNVYNVLFNFDIQWDLVSVFACYSIYFYVQTLRNENRIVSRGLAYTFLLLAFFSHAGALSLPLVFIVTSLMVRRYRETVLNIALLMAIFWLHQCLPFADPNNPDAQSALAMLLLHPVVIATFITKAISASLVFYLGKTGLFFSCTMWLLLITSIVSALRNKPAQGSGTDDTFLWIALFLFSMIATIAASRSIFTPNVWGASRFLTPVLLLILCLHIQVWLLIEASAKQACARVLKIVLAGHGVLLLGLVQMFNYNVAYKLSNAVFFSHAYMLTHERNQNNAPRLLLWLHGDDMIANSDPFFRDHGFAWYANKRVATPQGPDFVDSGNLVIGARAAAQSPSCETLPALRYRETMEGGIEFATPLDHFFPAAFHRQTYYAVNADGRVSGFAYVFVNEDGMVKHAGLQGYSLNRDIVAFVEASDDHMPHCVYRVSSAP